MAVTFSGKNKLMRYTRLYFGGLNLSGDSRTFGAAEYDRAPINMTAWSDDAENYLADRPMIRITGYQALMNPDSGRAFDQLKATDQNKHISLLFGGGAAPAIGDPAFVIPGLQNAHAIAIDAGAMVVSANFEQSATAGFFDARAWNPWAYTLHPDTSLSATTSASSVDLLGTAGSFTNGAQALLHIIASSGGTWAFTIEHSSNDAAWATYITFTANGSAVTSERQTSAATLNRYVRFVATRTSGTVTPVCTFAPMQ